MDLDAVLNRNRGGFIEHLDIDPIASAIKTHPDLVLSGVCMREVLERVAAPNAIHIYVKRMDLGIWTHEAEANGQLGDYCLLDRHAAPGELELEVRAYHHRWLPHEKADLVLQRERSHRMTF